jgi:hypothetical protein
MKMTISPGKSRSKTIFPEPKFNSNQSRGDINLNVPRFRAEPVP